MTTSGTYTFDPSLGESVLYAFARCGLKRTEVTTEHMVNARIAANMIQSDWANEQPNLWTVEEQIIPCVAGQSQYTPADTTILVLDAFLRENPGGPGQFDYYLYPISRTEWSMFPNKTIEGRPTVYWFDRITAPTFTAWYVPNDPTWEFHLWTVNNFQDAELTNGKTLQVPYYFLKAFSDRLAAELAVIYAPERAMPLMAVAERSWQKAAERNAEMVPLYITPSLTGYYR